MKIEKLLLSLCLYSILTELHSQRAVSIHLALMLLAAGVCMTICLGAWGDIFDWVTATNGVINKYSRLMTAAAGK